MKTGANHPHTADQLLSFCYIDSMIVITSEIYYWVSFVTV